MYDANGDLVTTLGSDDFYHCIEGPKTFTNQLMIKKDPYDKFVIDIDLKSVGSEYSSVYLFLECFRSNDLSGEITSSDITYVTDSGVIIDSINGKEIHINQHFVSILSIWYGEENNFGRKQIGFYLDGHTGHFILPDFIVPYEKIDGCKIILKEELPQNILKSIILGKTGIRNHYASGAHVYPFISTIKKEWTHISREISGFDFDRKDDPKKFRVGTKFFRVGLHANRNQYSSSILAFRNFKISKKLT